MMQPHEDGGAPASRRSAARTIHIAAIFLALLLACAAAPRAFAAGAVAIYPTAEVLPANHLKFYLHFPAPMRQGVFLDHCSLLDEQGRPVLEPFRETELWWEDRRRLTLWLHPGRQKTGVNLNVEFGPVLVPGRSYTLRISGRWPTENGTPLSQPAEKRFRAGPKIAGQLRCSDWQVSKPAAGTWTPLVVEFPAPLDHALLERCLRLEGPLGTAIDGEARTGWGESAWTFVPARPWRTGEYRLLIESILEDLAGNSLARSFEVDLHAAPQKGVPRVVSVAFKVGQ